MSGDKFTITQEDLSGVPPLELDSLSAISIHNFLLKLWKTSNFNTVLEYDDITTFGSISRKFQEYCVNSIQTIKDSKEETLQTTSKHKRHHETKTEEKDIDSPSI